MTNAPQNAHTIVVAPQSLIDYINKAKKAGKSHSEIEDVLKSRGWIAEDIDEAFSNLETTESSEPQKIKHSDGKSNKKLALLLLLIIVVVMIGAGVFALFTNGSPSISKLTNKLYGVQTIPTPNPIPKSAEQTILFTAAKTGSNGGTDVYTYAKGSATNLTSTPFGDYKGGSYATFSPDKSKIAYVTYKGQDAVIAVMNTDGSGRKVISKINGTKYFPSWSPDGSKILYENGTWATKPGETGKIELMQSDLESENEQAIQIPYQRISYPSWLPDNSGYIFVSAQFDPSGKKELDTLIVSKSGRYDELKPALSSVSDAVTTPAFSPDMKKIVFVGSNDNQIYLMNADGKGVKKLVSSSNLVFSCPNWSKDGSYVLAAVQENLKTSTSISYMMKINIADGSSSKINLNGLTNISCPRLVGH